MNVDPLSSNNNRQELRDLAIASAEEVSQHFDAYGKEPGSMIWSAVGSVAAAYVYLGQNESAHDLIVKSDLDVDGQFYAWSGLFRNGDKTALPHARRAIALASEQVSFVEALGVELHGIHSAEKIVHLVAAGDSEDMDLARSLAQNTSVIDRTGFLGTLYEAGDAQSLDLALEASRHAKEHMDRIDWKQYHRFEFPLDRMFSAAIRSDKLSDALRIAEAQTGESYKIEEYAKLYAAGYEPALGTVLDMVKEYGNNDRTYRILSKGGYEPALDVIRERTEKAEKKHRKKFGHKTQEWQRGELQTYRDDLLVLHAAGEESAKDKLVRVAWQQMDEYSYDWIRDFEEMGVNPTEFMEAVHDKFPSQTNAFYLAQLNPGNKVWKDQLEQVLKDGRVDSAAQMVTRLAFTVAQSSS